MSYADYGWKDYVFLIAALIFVVGDFLAFYAYQAYPSMRFTLVPNLALIPTAGLILLFGQLFVGAALPSRKRKADPS
jgi:hypothetical protein